MAVDTFIVRKEWLENISGLPTDTQDKIISEFVRYGCGLELAYADDPIVTSFVNMLKGRIDYSKEQYEKKVEMSKTAGRRKKIDDQVVFELAREGKNSAEIAQILGCGKSTIDHSEGWRQRKQEQLFI